MRLKLLTLQLFLMNLATFAVQEGRYAAMHKHFSKQEPVDPVLIYTIIGVGIVWIIVGSIHHHRHMAKLKKHHEEVLAHQKEVINHLKK